LSSEEIWQDAERERFAVASRVLRFQSRSGWFVLPRL
jgi:hypothetical protein